MFMALFSIFIVCCHCTAEDDRAMQSWAMKEVLRMPKDLKTLRKVKVDRSLQGKEG
jgi:hypothetical protein